MATATKPQRSADEIEDIILRKILLVSLSEPPSPSPQIVYLEQTAAELLSECKPLLLSAETTERVLIDRLSASPTPQPTFRYLLSCYSRCFDELKKISSMRDPVVRSRIEKSVKNVRQLILSYIRIHVGNPELFSSGGPAQPVADLLSLIFSEVLGPMDGFGGNSLGGSLTAPPGFIEEFFKDVDAETLDPIMTGLYEKLKQSVERVSPLGNFQQPLRALRLLVGYPNCAKALVNHHRWIPKDSVMFLGEGRVFELSSIMGAFLHVSAIPDRQFKSQPDVG
jgi:ubiquitin conjugation factor E4 B